MILSAIRIYQSFSCIYNSRYHSRIEQQGMEPLTHELDTIGFLSLPAEVQLLVLRFLDLPDLRQVRLVSWL